MSVNRARILVVDDDPRWCEILMQCLSDEGYIVDESQNIQQAKNKLKENAYQVAIVDMNLSKTDDVREGRQLLRHIQKQYLETRTIVISGETLTINEISDLFTTYGVVASIGKGKQYDDERLASIVESALSLKTKDIVGLQRVMAEERRQGGNSVVFQGDIAEFILKMEANMTDKSNVIKDIHGSIINIESLLENVSQTITAIPYADSTEKAKLTELIDQFEQAMKELPPEKQAEAQKLSKRLESLLNEVNDDDPDENVIEATGNSLLKAAENVKSIVPSVLTIAKEIVTFILGMSMSNK